MCKVLLTGFEPFGGESINPSLEVVKLMASRQLENVQIIGCEVPVIRYQAIETVAQAIEQHQPDLVIMIGQAAGRSAITPREWRLIWTTIALKIMQATNLWTNRSW